MGMQQLVELGAIVKMYLGCGPCVRVSQCWTVLTKSLGVAVNLWPLQNALGRPLKSVNVKWTHKGQKMLSNADGPKMTWDYMPWGKAICGTVFVLLAAWQLWR